MSGKKRYAVITGASGGLGSAFALQAARRGWNLILVDLPGTALAEVGRRLSRAYAIDAQCFEMDLSEGDARRRLLEWVRGTFLDVGLLVNNAGTGCHAGFDGAPIGRLAASVDVNVQGTMQMTWLFLPELKRQPRAAVINVASLAAFYPMPAMAVYAATKSFVLNFTLALRGELAGSRVTASALCPAGMVTNRETADQVEAQGFFGRITTWEPERVAGLALDRAFSGRAVIIPGLANRILRAVSSLVPRSLVVRVIGSRWRKAEQAVASRGTARCAAAAAPQTV
jgi:short-subunit dehydrogenase